MGGKKEIFDKVEPILKQMGSTVTLTGKIGAGNVTKLANQIMSVPLMMALAGVIFLERQWRYGQKMAVAVGVAAILAGALLVLRAVS